MCDLPAGLFLSEMFWSCLPRNLNLPGKRAGGMILALVLQEFHYSTSNMQEEFYETR